MSDPKHGDKATCKHCGEEIVWLEHGWKGDRGWEDDFPADWFHFVTFGEFRRPGSRTCVIFAEPVDE